MNIRAEAGTRGDAHPRLSSELKHPGQTGSHLEIRGVGREQRVYLYTFPTSPLGVPSISIPCPLVTYTMIDHPMDLMPTEAADPRDVFSGSNNFGEGVTSNGTGLFDTTRSLFASSSSSSSQGDDPTTNRDYPPVRPTLASYPQTRKTGIVYDVRMMLHAPADYRQDEGHVLAAQNVSPDGGADDLTSEQEYQASHPEEPRRISRIYAKLKEANLVLQMVDLPCPEVTPEQVLLVHSLQLWQALESTFCECYIFFLISFLLGLVSILVYDIYDSMFIPTRFNGPGN